MREFAEAEIVVPDGPFKGRKFRCDRQPFSALWFDAVDSGHWRRHVATGPVQTGKTLICFIIPLLYHLFEVQETVICGLPSLDMVADKWNEDILPAIEASRYRDLLPLKGPGSRGGQATRIQFRHGPTLRFMTGGGGDKSRAGFTSRVVVITETDGMDEPGESSREADKITQLESRTSAYPNARTYMECTVSIEEGRTWREYMAGTQSKIGIRCGQCREYVTPERENLIGWSDAEDVFQAGERARLVCPACGSPWTEPERVAANADCRLVHKGQHLRKDGAVEGELPRTDTLGFRWTAANNLLVPMGTVAQREWKAARAGDEDLAEREMRQFVWTLPHQAASVELTELHWQTIAKRVTADPRGRVPSDVEQLGMGVDLGKRLLHWTLIGIRGGDTPHVVDYGRQEVASDELGTEAALLAALRDLRDRVVEEGWASDLGPMRPTFQLVDAGNWDEVVYAFCRESGPAWIPAKGFGLEQRRPYTAPRQTNDNVVHVGEGYYIGRLPRKRVKLLHVDANHWKSWLHDRLATPLSRPGAMTLFKAVPADHTSIAKHFTAERQKEEFRPGRGRVIWWEVIHRNNHFLDSTCLAGIAARHAQVKTRIPVGRAPQVRVVAPPKDGTGATAAPPTPTPAAGSWFAARKRR